MVKLLLLIGLMLCLMSQPVRAEDPRIMQLVSREQNVLLTFDLPDNDWRWLGEKREVSVAIYAPENPPFDMVIDANTLEGISADYTALVLHYLGLHINTHYYSSRSAALDALQQGKVDMLVDSAGSPEPTAAELLLSTAFASDYPAMVSRDNIMSEMSDDNSPMQIAMPRGYLSDAWIEARYPEAKITRYPSALSALASLAFGENDYFIGNLNTANYLIERNYASTLSVIRIFEPTDAGPRFVLPIRNAPLF
ncbi:transporter substrate-binding domain-containing protein, partial [Pantoea sp. ME81]